MNVKAPEISDPVELEVRSEGFDRLPTSVQCAASGLWHVAHTKPRQEKALGEALLALGVLCFLPLVEHVRYYGHRKRSVLLPLFPSYLFFHGTKQQAVECLRTKRAAQLIPVPDQRLLSHELEQLDRAIAGRAVLDPFPSLAVGKRVVVARGPFVGLEGIVDERLSPGRLILNVSLLGRSTGLEIDASLLEPAE